MSEQEQDFTMEFDLHFMREGERVKAKPGRKPKPRREEPPAPEKLPRVVRMLALAHHLDGLLKEGMFKDYADLARVAGLTRARVTQIMILLHLSPRIQESLFASPERVRNISERDIAKVVARVRWDDQQEMWKLLVAR